MGAGGVAGVGTGAGVATGGGAGAGAGGATGSGAGAGGGVCADGSAGSGTGTGGGLGTGKGSGVGNTGTGESTCSMRMLGSSGVRRLSVEALMSWILIVARCGVTASILWMTGTGACSTGGAGVSIRGRGGGTTGMGLGAGVTACTDCGAGFSRSCVIGEKYWITTWRVACTAEPLCKITHSKAICNAPTVTSACMDIRLRGRLKAASGSIMGSCPT